MADRWLHARGVRSGGKGLGLAWLLLPSWEADPLLGILTLSKVSHIYIKWILDEV